ncbi:MAG: glycoside hydrolase family 43 protein [Planctomycetota bacterium]
MKIQNPVIPGFHPDPSICRVGGDYYLATSSFEYFPGVPIYHSRDLVNWRQVGHALTRPEQLPLEGVPCSGGIWAPSLRHHEGRFCLVTTNVDTQAWKMRNFFVTADDPAGDWSDPVWLDEGGIDPDIFLRPDGDALYMHTGEDGIRLGELELESGRVGEMRTVWAGTGGSHPEGPHLYRIDDTYYLMIAEGGTGRGHTETIARADEPFGPYEPCPHNPILTNRSREDLDVQCTGHADLVQAGDGSWWLVLLAVRLLPGDFPRVHTLGRETFLAPVEWRHGWPVVNGGQPIRTEMEVPERDLHPFPAPPKRDDFDTAGLRPCWNFLRNPDPDSWSLSQRPGWLTLHGSALTLDDRASPAFVGRRQQHFACAARARLDFEPTAPNEEAGMTVLMNDRHHYEIALTRREGARAVTARRRVGSLRAEEAQTPAGEGPIELAVEADPETYSLTCRGPDGGRSTLLEAETRYLSSEVAGGFTGIYLGMYATGNGRPCRRAAHFDWFDYEGIE